MTVMECQPGIAGLLGPEAEVVTSLRGPIAPLDMSAKHSPDQAQRIRSMPAEAGAQERIGGAKGPLGLAEGCTQRNP